MDISTNCVCVCVALAGGGGASRTNFLKYFYIFILAKTRFPNQNI